MNIAITFRKLWAIIQKWRIEWINAAAAETMRIMKIIRAHAGIINESWIFAFRIGWLVGRRRVRARVVLEIVNRIFRNFENDMINIHSIQEARCYWMRGIRFASHLHRFILAMMAQITRTHFPMRIGLFVCFCAPMWINGNANIFGVISSMRSSRNVFGDNNGDDTRQTATSYVREAR